MGRGAIWLLQATVGALSFAQQTRVQTAAESLVPFPR
jgi:hypothetical protein